WQSFRGGKKWPAIRALFSKHGKPNVVKALTSYPCNGSVGREERGSDQWSIYKLSLLGIFFAQDGEACHELLTRFLEFQRDLYKKDPLEALVSSSQVASALKLDTSETVLLGQLLPFAHLGGSEMPQDNWNTNAMAEAADFADKSDLGVE